MSRQRIVPSSTAHMFSNVNLPWTAATLMMDLMCRLRDVDPEGDLGDTHALSCCLLSPPPVSWTTMLSQPLLLNTM